MTDTIVLGTPIMTRGTRIPVLVLNQHFQPPFLPSFLPTNSLSFEPSQLQIP